MAQKIAFFDLDGTFFRWQLYHELVFELKTKGIFDATTADKLDASLIAWQAKQKTWREYETEIIQAFEPKIHTLDTTLFDEAAAAVVSRSGHKIYNYTRNLLNTVKSKGYFTLAISGSHQEIAEPFAAQYGFDQCIGALYERKDGRFTGAISRYVPGRKHEIITEFLGSRPDITLDDSIAVGDSEGDISMLQLVERPIAFNPSAELFNEAERCGWKIVIERKCLAYTLKKGDDGVFVLEKTETF